MFNCTQCGLCCKYVGKFPFMKNYARLDGSCKYLGENNLCSIYDKRPDICNVDKIYERYFANKMSIDEWHKFNEEQCKKIKEMSK